MMYYVTQYKRKEKLWFHHANNIEKKNDSFRYIESAILDKISTGLLFNGKTINGNVMNVFYCFFKSLQNHILVHLKYKGISYIW